MADVSIKYKGVEKATLNASGTKTIKTSGKYCEADVVVDYDDPKVAESWHQCPTLVRNYLDNVTYDPSDYTTTQIDNYAPSTPVTSNTKPIGITIDGVTYYNQIPNVATPFSSTNKSGTITPLDRLRWIKTNATNVRDLGGWTCDGGTIKYGKLYRGGEVLSQSDISIFLNDMGVRAELELQGTEGGNTSVLSPNVDYCCPMNEQFWALYTLVNKEQMQEAFSFIFESVKHNKPLYFHCYHGADRTGTIACLIEALLGVSQSDIDKDFELTSFYSFRRRTSSDWQSLINQINAFSGDTFRDKVVNYFVTLGFTADDLNIFRANMIDGTPSTLTPTIPTASITNTLSNVTNDNLATTINHYQPYEAVLTPSNNYAIENIVVTMGGVDITSLVVDGTFTNLNRSITKTLTHCSSLNGKGYAIDGQSYVEDIEANNGYKFDDLTNISITMGGVDITSQVVIMEE